MTAVPCTVITLPAQPTATATHADLAVRIGLRRWLFSFYAAAGADGELQWYFDLAVVPGAPILAGIGLAVGLDLLFPYRHLDVPPGPLFVRGPSADPTERGFFDGNWSVAYLDGVTPDAAPLAVPA